MEVEIVNQADKLLKAQQIADRLNISKQQAYRLMQIGVLPVVRFGRLTRVKESALQKFIDSHEVTLAVGKLEGADELGSHPKRRSS